MEEKKENKAHVILAPILENGKPSVGRLMLISIFILAMVKWVGDKEIPSTMLTMLITLVSYVMGSKFIGSAKDIVGKVKDTKNIVAQIKN